jgi:peptidoglycan/xylan/chitin deacetylase (PgdA/CDA1 family)
MFITSIDVDVGDEKVGTINRGRYDQDVHEHYSERFVGEVEQRNLPLLIKLFEDIEVPVTFAFRGQLFDVDTHLPRLVKHSSLKHEIGSHGYFHRAFTGLSHDEANEELRMTSRAMKKLDVFPRSFVFPRNMIAHLDLLRKYGYVCYRGLGGLIRDGMYVRRDSNGLHDVHPSLFIGWLKDTAFAMRIVDQCVSKKLPFHVWFHPKDLGDTEEQARKRIERILSPLLSHAKRKEKAGTLTFETMSSATNKAKATLKHQIHNG